MTWITQDLTVGRVDSQVDGEVGDALVGSRHAVRLVLNLLANLVKVGEFLSLAVQKFSVFVGRINQL